MREMSIEVNKLCNFRCSFCYTVKLKEDLPPIDSVLSVIEEGIRGGVTSLSLTGGEPLLQIERVTQISQFAKDRSLKVRLNTNGYLLSDEILGTLGGYIDEWQISFNASDNVRFSNYTGLALKSCPFDRVFNNIRKLKEADAFVSIRFTLDHDTVHDLIKVYDLFTLTKFGKDGGHIDKFKLRVSVPAGLVSNELFGEDSDRLMVREFFARVAKNPDIPVVVKDGTGILDWNRDCTHISAPACLCGENSIHISSDLRRITPCVFVRDDPQYSMGNLRDSGYRLNDVWASPIAKNFQKMTKRGIACPSHEMLASARIG